MAYALGYEGGYDDPVAAPEPAPAVGGGAPLYRTRWVPRPRPPAPPPVRVNVTIRVGYRWAAKVTAVRPEAHSVQRSPRITARSAAVTMWVVTRATPPATTVKLVHVDIDQVAASRFAYELRELTEVAVALTAWQ